MMLKDTISFHLTNQPRSFSTCVCVPGQKEEHSLEGLWKGERIQTVPWILEVRSLERTENRLQQGRRTVAGGGWGKGSGAGRGAIERKGKRVKEEAGDKKKNALLFCLHHCHAEARQEECPHPWISFDERPTEDRRLICLWR